MPKPEELPIIQRVYDLILRYVPRLNKLPHDYKYALGDRGGTQRLCIDNWAAFRVNAAWKPGVDVLPA